MNSMNERGFLLGEETIKIIIAVICIVGLIALVVGVYNNFSRNKEMEYAKASLDNLMNQINIQNTEVDIYNPNNWFISSFPQKDSGGNSILPKSCSSVGWKSCLCIYKLSNALKLNVAESVEKEGVCRQSDFEVVGTIYPTSTVIGGISPSLSGIYINNPPLALSIDYSAKKITDASGKTEFRTGGNNG